MKAMKVMHAVHRLVEMEEWVGKLWHRSISRNTEIRYPQAAVSLAEVRSAVAIFFRALGGDGGLGVEIATPRQDQARRSLIQRIAGAPVRIVPARREPDCVHLPPLLDVFPERDLNRALYFWLAALAAVEQEQDCRQDWVAYNQQLSQRALQRFPGLQARYQRLLQAQLALRPNPDGLPAPQAQLERSIQAVLRDPARPVDAVRDGGVPHAVYLWLYPLPAEALSPAPDSEDSAAEAGGEVKDPEEQRRYAAQRVEMPKQDRGLVLDRFENILSWAEFVKVDRSVEEDEELDEAEAAAEDLDQLSVSRDNTSVAKRIRFDLDLPAAENDDAPLQDGILLPEWDYRSGSLKAEYCCVQPVVSQEAQPIELPAKLRPAAKRLRAQFENLLPQRIWQRGQQQGSDIDLAAYQAFRAECLRGRAPAASGLYREFAGAQRDLACLLLADLSLSTDSWVSNEARIIDVIRDSLLLFAEALCACGDRFAMYGFSSRRREHVRINKLKAFEENYNQEARGRIAAIKPGFYTRMGAAIRYTSQLLAQQPASQRLLLILTDGKPNDLDLYEGRYGIEDTRMALQEARQAGMRPFCVTIDQDAGDYLPRLFGTGGYIVITRPTELLRDLPLLYAQLSGNAV